MAEASSGARDASPHHRTVGTSGAALPSAASEVELQVHTVGPRSSVRNRQQHWVRRLCSCFYTPQEETKPPISPPHPSKRLTLVLDLDETLVHSSFQPVSHEDFGIALEIDGKMVQIHVQKRPKVDYFLEKVGELFEVVIFTASLQRYADPIIDRLDINYVVTQRLYRQHCTSLSGGHVKDLSKLGRDVSRTVLVDVCSI